MNHESKFVRGTKGYEQDLDRFITISQALNFQQICKDFVPFLPTPPGFALDVGAGVGQNANTLAEYGYKVTAIEPMPDFLKAAKSTYTSKKIEWISDSLPNLDSQSSHLDHFHFILAEGMWHHLSPIEQNISLKRSIALLKPDGIFALSLRTGLAGLGTCVYQTDCARTVDKAESNGLRCIYCNENQPSIYKSKINVFWSRLVFQKTITSN